MPYSAGNVPDYVTGDKAKWAKIWNAIYAKTGSEQQAFQVANGVMLKALSIKTLYAPSELANTHELRALWNKVFGVASTICNDHAKARKIANGTIKRIASDADGRKSPGTVIVGSKRAWNAVFNSARAAHMKQHDAKRIASGVSGTRSHKSVDSATLAVLKAAQDKGVI